MTIQELTTRALKKLDSGRPLKDVLRFIDEWIPLPECSKLRAKAEWKREVVKMNVQAEFRQTKTTGPSLIK